MKTPPALFLLFLASASLAAPQTSSPPIGGSGSSTENDVTNDAPCKALTVIFARGTSEPGNVGTVAGPPFFEALQSAVGANMVALQGVNYSASWDGAFEGGDPTGSSTMASLVGQAIKQCPDTKVVLSGYSQGAQLVHNSAKQLSSALTADISSVIVFGDPDNGQAVGSIPTSKVDSFCASGDTVCDGAGIGAGITSAHLTYGQDADQAAAFVAEAAGLSS
ncbi:hypothetical protein MMC28_009336 [Mycoblastus sanguinarius]|nr:hypothetical protein [Mycoblastus sanguinarius]